MSKQLEKLLLFKVPDSENEIKEILDIEYNLLRSKYELNKKYLKEVVILTKRKIPNGISLVNKTPLSNISYYFVNIGKFLEIIAQYITYHEKSVKELKKSLMKFNGLEFPDVLAFIEKHSNSYSVKHLRDFIDLNNRNITKKSVFINDISNNSRFIEEEWIDSFIKCNKYNLLALCKCYKIVEEKK